MQKNWYTVYTRPHCEKKIVSILTKMEIENFCPLNYRTVKHLRRIKMLREPLFKSYVFVCITPGQIDLLNQMNGVINFLYWVGEPAIIKQDEIDAIKEFTSDYRNIELSRMHVNINDIARAVDSSSYSLEGNRYAVKSKIVKVSLPSLGYIISAKIEDESIFEREVIYKNIRAGIYNEIQHQ